MPLRNYVRVRIENIFGGFADVLAIRLPELGIHPPFWDDATPADSYDRNLFPLNSAIERQRTDPEYLRRFPHRICQPWLRARPLSRWRCVIVRHATPSTWIPGLRPRGGDRPTASPRALPWPRDRPAHRQTSRRARY